MKPSAKRPIAEVFAALASGIQSRKARVSKRLRSLQGARASNGCGIDSRTGRRIPDAVVAVATERQGFFRHSSLESL